jgi:hypothetical protein
MMHRIVLPLIALLLAAPCMAQTPAARLAEQARAQIDGLNADSAFKLLAVALRQSTTNAERLRGFTLLAITELMRGNHPAARQAFERAIRLDPSMRIDSLADLSTDAQMVFAQARTAVGPLQAERPVDAVRAPLAVAVQVPADTTLSIANPRLVISAQPNARARLTASVIAPDLGNRVLWEQASSASESQRSMLEWSLRGADGTLMPSGRYILRVTATDSAGLAAPAFERVLRVARAAVDTQAHPAPLAASALAPERARVGSRTPVLIWGSSIAALIVATPMIMGNPTLNKGLSGDPTAYAVAGGVAVGSIVGFLRGGGSVPLADNVKQNQQLRDNDRLQRDAIIRANASARSQAAIRVTVEGAP